MVSARVGLLLFMLVCGVRGAQGAELAVENAKVAYPSAADADAFRGAFAKYEKLEMGLGTAMFNDLNASGVARVSNEFNSSQNQVSPYVEINSTNFSCGFFHGDSGFGIMAVDAKTIFLGFDSFARNARPAPIAIPNLRCFSRK